MIFKRATCLLLSLVMTYSYASIDQISIFETESFLIKLTNQCEEGNVACDKILYTGVRKKDGASLSLKGATLNRDCQIGSCDMLGYQFQNGNYIYSIYGRNPALTIEKNGKSIFSEDGQFSDNIDDDLIRFEKLQSNAAQSVSNNKLINLSGSALIQNPIIIEKLHQSCNFPTYQSTQTQMESCIIAEISPMYYYVDSMETDNLPDLRNNKRVYLAHSDDFNLYIERTANDINDIEITLYTEKDRRVIDSIAVFKQKIWEAGANFQYYYIDKKRSKFWLLTVIEDEENRRPDMWREYQINRLGHFELLKTISCQYDDNNAIQSAKCRRN